jgi:hypothetical protein
VELGAEEVEQRGIPEVDPQALRVEVREGDEEVAEGGALAAEEVGERGGELTCGVHGGSLARDIEAS